MDRKDKIFLLVILVAGLFVLKIIEPGDDNHLSFSEFLENIEEDNVKMRIFVNQDTIFFEPKKSSIKLKSGLREYDRLRYSVTVPESD